MAGSCDNRTVPSAAPTQTDFERTPTSLRAMDGARAQLYLATTHAHQQPYCNEQVIDCQGKCFGHLMAIINFNNTIKSISYDSKGQVVRVCTVVKVEIIHEERSKRDEKRGNGSFEPKPLLFLVLLLHYLKAPVSPSAFP